MKGFKDDGEALIYEARQLSDAFAEAGSDEDRDYAADAIEAFLTDHDEYAPDEALVHLIDLPLTKRSWYLLERIAETLAARGPGVVGPLLEAERHHTTGPPPERVQEVFKTMRPEDLRLGLISVCGGRYDDDIKQEAVDALVAVGDEAVPALETALYDPAARPWAEDALGDIRAARVESSRLQGLEEEV